MEKTVSKGNVKTHEVVQNKTQPIIGIVLAIALIGFSVYLNSIEAKLVMQLFAGLMMGYVLSRGRFGFAGGVKRVMVRGEGTLTKALLVMAAVTLIVTFGIQWKAAQGGAIPAFLAKEGQAIIPGTQNVSFANIGTVLGGFFFGMGMIFSGGCASGTLTDMGEGEVRAWITFPFFILGSIPGELARYAVDQHAIGKIGAQAYLPDTFGFFGSLALSLVGLGAIYLYVVHYEKKRREKNTYLDPYGDWEDFEKEIPEADDSYSVLEKVYHKLFVERFTFMKTGLLLAFAWIFILVSQGKSWGVTTAFSHLEVYVGQLFGAEFTNPKLVEYSQAVSNGLLQDGGTIRNLGLVVGALLAFLMAGRLKLSFGFKSKDSIYFAIGGLIMGFGARLAKGCNAGALYSGISTFALSGWVFLVAMTLGAVVALKAFAGKASTLPKLK